MELFNPQATQPTSSLKPYFPQGLPAGDGGTQPVSPLAAQLQTMGRGYDSTLVHMTPGEVNSLRGLAQRFGGDLTTNPNTGLPEAGFLSSILPVIAGAALSFIPGVGPLAAAGIVGAADTAITGDLSKGLMAGLGAFGGASLAGSLGSSAASTAGSSAAAAGSTANPAPLAETLASGAGTAGTSAAGTAGLPADFLNGVVPQITSTGAPLQIAMQPASALTTQLPNVGPTGFFDKFAAASRAGLPQGGMLSKAAPYAAGLGLLNAGSQALQPNLPKYQPEEESPYAGPYKVTPRRVLPPLAGGSSREQLWFTPREGAGIYGASGYADGGEARYHFSSSKDLMPAVSASPAPVAQIGGLANLTLPVNIPGLTPEPRPVAPAIVPTAPGGPGERLYRFSRADALRAAMPAKPFDISSVIPSFGFAEGGETIEDGSFIVDARTVSEIGNGSSNAGIEALARMGGTPISGPGDGVSDSIPASLEGEPARVARDEVKFSPDAVKKLGGGSHKKGTQKLYSLMQKAHNARKKAGRGEDTKMAKGLASL